MADGIDTLIAPVTSLASQPWWQQLHGVIITAFLHKPENASVFPPDWKRLPDDPTAAAQSFASELGGHGHLIVLMLDGQPVASSGVLPYRGATWISDAQSGKSDIETANTAATRTPDEGAPSWEVCCFCVSPPYRRRGLSRRLLNILESFVKDQGAKRLYANYAEIETGNFWPRMGFVAIPGAGGVLKKGFKAHPDKEGLRADIVFTMAVKSLKA